MRQFKKIQTVFLSFFVAASYVFGQDDGFEITDWRAHYDSLGETTLANRIVAQKPGSRILNLEACQNPTGLVLDLNQNIVSCCFLATPDDMSSDCKMYEPKACLIVPDDFMSTKIVGSDILVLDGAASCTLISTSNLKKMIVDQEHTANRYSIKPLDSKGCPDVNTYEFKFGSFLINCEEICFEVANNFDGQNLTSLPNGTDIPVLNNKVFCELIKK
jgi:hypothetical protein